MFAIPKRKRISAVFPNVKVRVVCYAMFVLVCSVVLPYVLNCFPFPWCATQCYVVGCFAMFLVCLAGALSSCRRIDVDCGVGSKADWVWTSSVCVVKVVRIEYL